MEQNLFLLEIAGCSIPCHFIHKETAEYFGSYCRELDTGKPVIGLTEDDLTEVRAIYPIDMDDAKLEYNELTARISDIMLPWGRCIFHGVAFLWRGKAWIFTGPSGIGKTTQYVRWKILYGEDVSILNGDKPVLECCKDGRILVHPSPWNGKECMGRMETAPLGGIIFLQQGSENSIRPLTAKEAVVPFFSQVLFMAETEEIIPRVSAILEEILRNIPVWMLTNRGDEASAQLTHDVILQSEEERT